MRIRAAGLSDVGLQRDHNEDTYCCIDNFGLYLVADGMGGHQSGEVASMMAADAVRSFFEATMKYAEAHRAVIQRFGRFPHRNRVLGRPNTRDEDEYLKGGADRFGQ